MRFLLLSIILIVFFSCKKEASTTEPDSSTDTIIIKDSIVSEVGPEDFRTLKVIDSEYLTNEGLFGGLNDALQDFSQEDHDRLKPFIFEQDIPTIQSHIKIGDLTYEALVKFYLFRIKKYDRENPISLNSVISLNPNVIAQAKLLDETAKDGVDAYSVFGMPLLLKDNINTKDMATTAGAVVLQNNLTNDAFVTQKLKEKGALILGKANLSEWAYFFCGDCPSGFSALGGQTLNPYGRRIFDTGGSSSGSGVAVAANFCVAALGSETSGSILSPSSQNGVVGLKPTIGLVSRSGIIPISSTLDTAGPMTKNVTDNAILLSAIYGEDESDTKSIWSLWEPAMYFEDLNENTLIGKRFGAIKRLMNDTLYVQAIDVLKAKGAEIIEIEPARSKREGFISLLNLDMRKDLPRYLQNYASDDISVKSVADVIHFNEEDSLKRAPYGQRLFRGILADSGNLQTLDSIKKKLKSEGKSFFDAPMKAHQLDAVLSINNYHAGYAAVAEYPAITVPMGYTDEGKPAGLTFIAERLREKQLLEWAFAYEQASKQRLAPKNYH